MTNGLNMDYGDMGECCTLIARIAEEILQQKNDMISKVQTLCDSWEAEASPIYREDFETVGKQIDSISELVNSLTTSITNYIADMQQVDGSYAQR